VARAETTFFLKRLEAHLYPKLANEAAVPTAPRMSLARVQFIADIIFLLGFFRKRVIRSSYFVRLNVFE
jgi:hypothetical protein